VEISLEQIARALNGKIRNGQVIAAGPGHSAADESLSVTLSDTADGGFIVKSFANDDWKTCKNYVLEKLGLPAFKPNGHRRSEADIIAAVVAAAEQQDHQESRPKAKPVAAYDYTDADGTLLYQVCRYIPKRFAHRQPDGRGGWIHKGTHKRVVYRWPSINKYPDATIFICEGEKDVDNVAALGLCATTVASGKWTDDCVQALAGRDCWILEDADDAGRAKALEAAKLLHPVAQSVKVIRLPGLADGCDVSDWLDMGHSKEELYDVCASTPDWQPDTKQQSAPEVTKPIPVSKSLVAYPLVRFGDVSVSAERDYLIKGLLPRVGLVLAWGQPKCGKSFWAMDTALHIALGWTYRDRKTHQASVVYFALEGHGGYARRIEAFRRYHNVTDAPFYLLRSKVNLVRKVDQLIKDIEAQLGNEPPGAIFVDTLNRSMPGSESSDEDMSAYLEAAGKMEQHFGCCVVVIHHCGLDATRPRGHTSLTAAVDMQIAIKRGGDLEVIATVEYAKDDAEGAEVYSRLHPVDIGFDPDGDPIGSLVVLPADKNTIHKPLPNVKATNAADVAMRALMEAISEMGKPAPASNHIPSKTMIVTIADWRKYAYQAGISTGGDRARQKAFERASEWLNGKKRIGIWNEFVWIANR
jgi:AAA domain